jgi:hypothetical protein
MRLTDIERTEKCCLLACDAVILQYKGSPISGGIYCLHLQSQRVSQVSNQEIESKKSSLENFS